MIKVRVNPGYCKACGLCLLACKKGVLRPGGDVNPMGYHPVEADPEKDCIGCRLCAAICPDAAIEIVDE